MTIIWSAEARRSLRAIHKYIAQDSQYYAARMISRIVDRVESAAVEPSQGHVVHEYPELPLREVHESPYRINLRVFRHGADGDHSRALQAATTRREGNQTPNPTAGLTPRRGSSNSAKMKSSQGIIQVVHGQAVGEGDDGAVAHPMLAGPLRLLAAAGCGDALQGAKVSADTGYFSNRNLEVFKAAKVDAYLRLTW